VDDAAASQAAAPQAPPPPEVGVVELQTANVALPLEFSGRVASFRAVESRPGERRAQKREFQEGAIVKAGEVCSASDARTYEAPCPGERRSPPGKGHAVQAEENFNASRGWRRRRSRLRRVSRMPLPPATRRARPLQSTEADLPDGQAQPRIHHHQGAGHRSDQPGRAAEGTADQASRPC